MCNVTFKWPCRQIGIAINDCRSPTTDGERHRSLRKARLNTAGDLNSYEWENICVWNTFASKVRPPSFVWDTIAHVCIFIYLFSWGEYECSLCLDYAKVYINIASELSGPTIFSCFDIALQVDDTRAFDFIALSGHVIVLGSFWVNIYWLEQVYKLHYFYLDTYYKNSKSNKNKTGILNYYYESVFLIVTLS